MTYQTADIRMTLEDHQGNSSIACLFKCDFYYSFAAVYKT